MTLILYWRPGCGYCRRLRRALERAGVAYEQINIWEDSRAAEFVRSVADGNETVPTVRLQNHSWVNPRPQDLLDSIRGLAPDLIDGSGSGGRPRLWRILPGS